MACCGSGCSGGGRMLLGAGAIAFMGIAMGGVHSWLTPVVLRPDVTKTTPTIIPAVPLALPHSLPDDTAKSPMPVLAPTMDQTAHQGTGQSQGQVQDQSQGQPQGVTLGFEIKSDQAKLLFDRGVPFIDAREAPFFAEGHVERAMNMTADTVISNAAELVQWRPGPIVVYCNGGDCDASHHVATRLQALQFTQIHIMTDGFPAWKDKGYPVVAGK